MTVRFPSKGRLRRAAALPPTRLALGAAARLVRPRGGELVVAMFHRVLSARRFEDQLDALLEGGTPVTGSRVLEAHRGGEPLPRGAVWITFDDAYGEVIELALPVLERRGVLATHFVPTAYVGANPSRFWWDELEDAFDRTARTAPLALEAAGERTTLPMGSRPDRGRALRLARGRVKEVPPVEADAVLRSLLDQLEVEPAPDCRVMGWSELRRLANAGHEVCGHTHTHPMLDRVTPEEARGEVGRGFEELRAHLDRVPPIFAYPSGQYDRGVLGAVRDAGVQLAVTTREAIHRAGADGPLEVPRIPVGPHADGSAVRVRLLRARLRR